MSSAIAARKERKKYIIKSSHLLTIATERRYFTISPKTVNALSQGIVYSFKFTGRLEGAEKLWVSFSKRKGNPPFAF